MFWGLSIEGGKHYSQIVNETFNVTMAALETREFSGVDPKPSGLAQVIVRHDRTEFLLCSLHHGHLHQQPLNLCFSEGEEVTFFMEGKGMVHLSGFLRPSFNMDDGDMDYPSMSESESEESLGNTSDDESITLQDLSAAKELLESDDEEEENEADWMPPGKRRKKMKISKSIKAVEVPKRKKAKKTTAIPEEEDYDEEEDEDYVYEGSGEDEDEEDDDEDDNEFVLYEAEEASEDEESEVEEEEEEPMEELESEEEVQVKKTKTKKKGKNKKKDKNGTKSNETPKEIGSEKKCTKNKSIGDNKENIERKALAETNILTPKQKPKQSPKQTPKQTPKSEKKTPKSQVKKEDSSPEKKSSNKKQKSTPQKLKGGTTILDLKEGDGPVAKAGKRVFVHYRGTVASSQKQFDSCTSGSGFPFRLGKGEVIKGWDIGVEGMKVGGKRKITIPPHQGYGGRRTGPIPPNSTLIFEVELKNIK